MSAPGSVQEKPRETAPARGVSGDLFDRIDRELKAQRDLGLVSTQLTGLDAKWNEFVSVQPKRFINPDFTVNRKALASFRKHQLFISDVPFRSFERFNLRNLLDGARRGEKQLLRDCFETLKREGHLEVLKQYPSDPAGNPEDFVMDGYRFTYRWHKHIHFIGLWRKFLVDRLPADYVGMDIGSSYGIFPSLLKKERPRSRHVLVDFPEQLLLAYYFLGKQFPEARIAGAAELGKEGKITREFIQRHDFILLPCPYYDRLEKGSVDQVSNFASFGEMRREWFEGYVRGAAFQGAKYFFTSNRFQSRPTYDTDLTIFDYPVLEPAKKIHFGVSPAFSHQYTRKWVFFYEKLMFSSPYFDYIGRI